jgi:acyl-CoA reductase-like NAD-dependent aldehyde dehydrogenase
VHFALYHEELPEDIFNNSVERNKYVYSKKKFGPVVALTTFSSTEEAIAIANDTPYGLGAGVWSRDAHNYSKFHVLFKQVEFG